MLELELFNLASFSIVQPFRLLKFSVLLIQRPCVLIHFYLNNFLSPFIETSQQDNYLMTLRIQCIFTTGVSEYWLIILGIGEIRESESVWWVLSEEGGHVSQRWAPVFTTWSG